MLKGAKVGEAELGGDALRGRIARTRLGADVRHLSQGPHARFKAANRLGYKHFKGSTWLSSSMPVSGLCRVPGFAGAGTQSQSHVMFARGAEC